MKSSELTLLLFTVYLAAASGRSLALPCFAAFLALVRFSGLFAFTQFFFRPTIPFTNLRKQFPRRILIILRLSRPQLLVNAALADKLIVRTALGNSSIVHNGYLVAKAA